MASPTEVTKNMPDTLPADFIEWDGADSEEATPLEPSGSDSRGKAQDERSVNAARRAGVPLTEHPRAFAASAAKPSHNFPAPKSTVGYGDKVMFLSVKSPPNRPWRDDRRRGPIPKTQPARALWSWTPLRPRRRCPQTRSCLICGRSSDTATWSQRNRAAIRSGIQSLLSPSVPFCWLPSSSSTPAGSAS